MENLEYRKDDEGLWNKDIKPKDLPGFKSKLEKQVQKIEQANHEILIEKAEILKRAEKVDDSKHEIVNDLEEIIFAMKQQSALSEEEKEILRKLEEELVEEKEKRESGEPRFFEKLNQAKSALENKENLIN